MPFYINTNRQGIPLVQNNGVTVEPDKVIINFANHAFRNTFFLGYVTVYLIHPIPAGTPATLPVEFETNGTSIELTSKTGDIAYVSDIGDKLSKYLQLFYNKSNNTLQLI